MTPKKENRLTEPGEMCVRELWISWAKRRGIADLAIEIFDGNSRKEDDEEGINEIR